MTEPSTHQDPAVSSPVQFAVVGGLLVLIVALLAVLWWRERSGRLEAQRELASARAELVQVKQTLTALLMSKFAATTAPAAFKAAASEGSGGTGPGEPSAKAAGGGNVRPAATSSSHL